MCLKSLRSIAVRLLLVDFSVFRLKTCLIKIHRTKTNKQQSWRTLHALVMHTLYIYCGNEVRRSSVNLPSGCRYLKVNFLSKELTRERKWFSSTKVQSHTGKTYANIIGSPNFCGEVWVSLSVLLVGSLSFVLGLKIFLIFSLKLCKFDNELQIRITVSCSILWTLRNDYGSV